MTVEALFSKSTSVVQPRQMIMITRVKRLTLFHILDKYRFPDLSASLPTPA